MNKTLDALMTKLNWQLSELGQNLLSIEQQLATLEQQCAEIQQNLVKACAISAFIIPEREIARLHYQMHQQIQHDELNNRKSALLAQQATLNAQKIRLNTELKMLEKYQENQLKNTQRQMMLMQQNFSDEWVLQHREPL